ncbi:MAG: hypothetical protein ACXU8N_17250 [Telluria sp.]
MVTSASLNTVQLQVALAERQVARDQAQVDADQAQLDQSQQQLVKDQRDLSATQDRQRTAVAQKAAAATPTLTGAIATQGGKQLPAAETPVRATVNARGEPLGKLINVAA